MEATDSLNPSTFSSRKNLNSFVIGSVPTVFYIPDFISDAEHKQLVDKVFQSPVSKWKSLKNRRLQNWGGIVHKGGLVAQALPHWLTRITERIYEETELFPSAINHVLINEYLPNQGIMAHQDGPAYFPVVAILSLGSPVVMDFTPHSSLKDGSMSEYPDCSIPIGNNDTGCDNRLDNCHPFSVLLMPRSLLIFKDTAYSDYLHGIKDNEVQQLDGALNATECLRYRGVNQAVDLKETEDLGSIHRTTNRISLTCRVVLKVQKNLFKI